MFMLAIKCRDNANSCLIDAKYLFKFCTILALIWRKRFQYKVSNTYKDLIARVTAVIEMLTSLHPVLVAFQWTEDFRLVSEMSLQEEDW